MIALVAAVTWSCTEYAPASDTLVLEEVNDDDSTSANMVCGDGRRSPGERCDDGNTAGGDGCTADCFSEAGYACHVAGEPCVFVVGCGDSSSTCNDGVRDGSESCDDGDDIIGDGCDPSFQIEPDCNATGCHSACGDGLPDDNEECDDGNTLADDGCSPSCQVETGFECSLIVGSLPAKLELPVTFRDVVAVAAPGATRHPDFQAFDGTNPTFGLVETQLGSDEKPVYTGICEQGALTSMTCPFEGQTTTHANFDQWYRDVPGINVKRVTTLSMDRVQDDVYQFPATLGTQLFPFDGDGWVDEGSETASNGHNFGFTTEIRHWFRFRGGERLTFSGDDDVWVFMNTQLALDLGGLHPRQESTIVLDAATGEARCSIDVDGATPCATPTRAIGLRVGHVYEMAIFHAERRTSESNFDLTLAGFVSSPSNCETVQR